MKTDLINIFNRLTSSELADYNLFSEILENHYEKFKYLYSLIEDVNLNKVEQIYCKANKSSLRVIIEPHNVSYINDIIFSINGKRDNYTFSKHFKLNLVETQNYLLIEIGTKNNKKEGEMYDHRFV